MSTGRTNVLSETSLSGMATIAQLNDKFTEHNADDNAHSTAFNTKIDKDDVSNPNLLVNSNSKVNQRGLTEYTNSSNAYTFAVDRWAFKKGGDTSATITVSDNGVTISPSTAMVQIMDSELVENITGKTLTLSVNIDDVIISGTFTWTDQAYFIIKETDSLRVAYSATGKYIQIFNTSTTESKNIKWAKLELGSVATQFVVPDPITEKIKCGIPDDTSEYGYSATVNAATVGGYTLGGNISTNDIAKLSATNIAYGTCATAAATAAKVVTITGNTNWKLAVGSEITVKFTNTNTASNCTLNVNNTGAKKIWYNNAVYTGTSSNICGYANRYFKFMYDGTNWVWMGNSTDLNKWTAASATVAGYVTTGAQTFAGDKTFNGNITATGNITGAKVYNAIWNADYAEGFEYEGELPSPGQIVELCGNNKIKIASTASNKVIGVCSKSYWVLAGCKLEEIENKTKVAIGLVGQLPIQVEGEVKFGDYIVCGGNGIGVVNNTPQMGQIIGRAMESNSTPELKSVNCIIQTR